MFNLCHKTLLPFAIVVILILFAYTFPPSKYFLKEQWYTSGGGKFPIRQNPKKVVEYFYGGENNMFPNDSIRFSSFDEYNYDISGNLLKRKLWFDEYFWNEFSYKYTGTGYITDVTSMSRDSGIKKQRFIKFEKISNSKYLHETFFNGELSERQVYSYSDDGNEITIESQHPKTHATFLSTKNFYDDQRILKKVITEYEPLGTGERIWDYYYDRKNILDSIVSGDRFQHRIYVKNELGDPVEEIEMSGKDTIGYKKSSYLYDSKGNWIRMVETEQVDTSFNSHNKSILIVRKINY